MDSFKMNTAFLACLVALTVTDVASGQTTAFCNMVVNSALPPAEQQPIVGTVNFSQQTLGGAVIITGELSGFDSGDADTKHGFHVHETADWSNGCDSTGAHFNPHGTQHGGPTTSERHVGDLGNIEEDGSGGVSINFSDGIIDFSGTNNIMGRTLDIHANEDDLGLGGVPGSNTTGNAGRRIACCVITDSSTGDGAPPGVTASVIVISGAIITAFWALV